MILLSACAPQKFFYYPNKQLYADPDKLGLTYDMMQFPSANGSKLFGLLFKSSDTPKGIIVHFHGNFGNVSNHFPASHFLTYYGFDVLVFDYQGYGDSEGKPTIKNTVEDGIAAIQFAATLNRNPNGGVVIFGQSLGGAVAMVAMAKEPLAKAAVIESSFPSYRTMTRNVLGRSFLTWILYPIYPFFVGKKYDPERYLEKISPRPLFFIHGTTDNVVPVKMSKRLYEKAKDPKELWIVEGATHMGLRSREGKTYERRITEFFEKSLSAAHQK